MFGLGGMYVEVLKDVAFRLAPLSQWDAQAMIHELKSLPLLTGYRGQPAVDLAALERTLLQVSALAEAYPEIKELDLNPVFAYPNGCLAVDARVVLHAEGAITAPRPLSATMRATLARAFNPRAAALVVHTRAMNYKKLPSHNTVQGKLYAVKLNDREL